MAFALTPDLRHLAASLAERMRAAIVALHAALSAYTYSLVGRAVAKTGAANFGELWDACFSPSTSWVIDVMIMGVAGGACLTYGCFLGDLLGDTRAIWEHTRLEAMRYVPMVPRKDAALLADPSRQAEMIDAFLRQRAHDLLVVEGPQVFQRSAAAGEDQHVAELLAIGAADGRGKLRRRLRALHRHAEQRHLDQRPAPLHSSSPRSVCVRWTY